jgi:mono/diheme cytochrome c family protein
MMTLLDFMFRRGIRAHRGLLVNTYFCEFIAQFLTQNRVGSTMHRAIAPADTADPESLRNLAAYLSEAPALKNPERGDGLAVGMGKQLFESNCALCHGKLAQGSESEPIPKLAGQHYPYLLAQLNSFAAGHRNQVEPPVLDFTAGLSPAQRSAIADYLSRGEAQPPRN